MVINVGLSELLESCFRVQLLIEYLHGDVGVQESSGMHVKNISVFS